MTRPAFVRTAVVAFLEARPGDLDAIAASSGHNADSIRNALADLRRMKHPCLTNLRERVDRREREVRLSEQLTVAGLIAVALAERSLLERAWAGEFKKARGARKGAVK